MLEADRVSPAVQTRGSADGQGAHQQLAGGDFLVGAPGAVLQLRQRPAVLPVADGSEEPAARLFEQLGFDLGPLAGEARLTPLVAAEDADDGMVGLDESAAVAGVALEDPAAGVDLEYGVGQRGLGHVGQWVAGVLQVIVGEVVGIVAGAGGHDDLRARRLLRADHVVVIRQYRIARHDLAPTH